MEKQHLIDFADWLWDMDRLKVTTQLPPFENSGMMVELYLKAKMLNDECEGKADSTSEKDLRVCEVIASAWISVKERLPEIHIDVLFSNSTDKWVSVGFIGQDKKWYNIGDSSGCECYPTHWMPLPTTPK